MKEVRGGDGVGGGGVTRYNSGKYEAYKQNKKGLYSPLPIRYCLFISIHCLLRLYHSIYNDL